jgi:hypothetical protein
MLGVQRSQTFKSGGIAKLIGLGGNQEFSVEVTQQQDTIAHHIVNNFQFLIDN